MTFLAKIIVFYIVYYTCLTGFFMAMLLAFFKTLDDREPTWTYEKGGLIGKNPGLGFRPKPDDKHVESTLIWYRTGESNGDWEKWVERLGDFIKVTFVG